MVVGIDLIEAFKLAYNKLNEVPEKVKMKKSLLKVLKNFSYFVDDFVWDKINDISNLQTKISNIASELRIVLVESEDYLSEQTIKDIRSVCGNLEAAANIEVFGDSYNKNPKGDQLKNMIAHSKEKVDSNILNLEKELKLLEGGSAL